MNLYALYRGDKFIDVGTSAELCKKYNWSLNTFRWFAGSNRYKKRCELSDNLLSVTKIKINSEEKKELFYGN